MGLDMFLDYRRNLGGIPETIQRAMRKQAFIDAYPSLAEHYIEKGTLDKVIDARISKGEPYGESLMYWRKANAIHKFFVDTCADGIDESQPIEVPIDVLADLLGRCETILASGPNDDELIIDEDIANELLPTHDGFFFGSTDYDDWYIEDLKATTRAIKPIVDHPELYPDPIIYQASW